MNEKIKQFQQDTRSKICLFLSQSSEIEVIDNYNKLQFDLGYSLLAVLSKHENQKVEGSRRAYLTTHQPFWSWWQADYAQHDHYFLAQAKSFKLINLTNYQAQELTEEEKWAIYQFSKYQFISKLKAPDFFKYFTYNT